MGRAPLVRDRLRLPGGRMAAAQDSPHVVTLVRHNGYCRTTRTLASRDRAARLGSAPTIGHRALAGAPACAVSWAGMGDWRGGSARYRQFCYRSLPSIGHERPAGTVADR